MAGILVRPDLMPSQKDQSQSSNRYLSRGVSADKTDVHAVVDQMDAGLVPGAFCKVTDDLLGGDPNRCNVIHADGAGTKSILAYLHYREFGDPTVFHGIAQDSIVMNLDDLLCVGAVGAPGTSANGVKGVSAKDSANGNILISSTINRNATTCPGEVIAALIEGTEAFLQQMRDLGINIHSGGGETADVGDLTGTVVVDSCAVAMMDRSDLIKNQITADLAIVGFSSSGQASWEAKPNSGVGSNGLTSARHDLLCNDYAQKYPETFDPSMPPELAYCGPWRLEDKLPQSSMTVGEALLSPTRTYAPLVQRLKAELGDELIGLVHCSGGAQTKCLRFGEGVHYIKDQLFEPPPLFAAIQEVTGTSTDEMYKVFNMGHRMEAYVPPGRAAAVMSIAASLGIDAQVVGRTEAAKSNQLTLTDPKGNTCQYP